MESEQSESQFRRAAEEQPQTFDKGPFAEIPDPQGTPPCFLL